MISWHTSTELLNQNSGAWVAASGNLTCLSNTQMWHEKQHSPHKSFQIEWALTHTFIHWGAQTIPTSCYTGCREMCHSSPSRSKNAEWQDTWIYTSTQCTLATAWESSKSFIYKTALHLPCATPRTMTSRIRENVFGWCLRTISLFIWTALNLSLHSWAATNYRHLFQFLKASSQILPQW